MQWRPGDLLSSDAAWVDVGAFDPEIDRVALHAVMTTAVYGYLLHRRSFAAELGIAVDELDERVAHLLYCQLSDELRPPAVAGPPVARDAIVVRGTDPDLADPIVPSDCDLADPTDPRPDEGAHRWLTCWPCPPGSSMTRWPTSRSTG